MEYNITLPELETFCDFKLAKICPHCDSNNTIRHNQEDSRIIKDTKLRFMREREGVVKIVREPILCTPKALKKVTRDLKD